MAISKAVCGGIVGKVGDVATRTAFEGALFAGPSSDGSFAGNGPGRDIETRLCTGSITGWKTDPRRGGGEETKRIGGPVLGWKIAGNFSSWCQDLGRSGSVSRGTKAVFGLLLEQDGWESPFGSVEGIVRCAFAHF